MFPNSADEAREFLTAGAVAVEIDSGQWIEPGIAEQIELESNGTWMIVDEHK